MAEEVTDATIVDRCRAGDVDAFGILLDRYQRPIFQAILHRVWNYEDARELCQQTFLKAFQHLDGFDPRYKFFSWIYRIAMNESINHLRARRPLAPLEDCPGAEGEAADPQATFEALQRSSALYRALAGLEEKYRSVVVLCHLLQLSYHDAAESLGLDERTVKSRLYTARQLLRERLEGLGHAG